VSADRDSVADELTEFLQTIGLGDPWSDEPNHTTRWLYSDDGVLYEPDRLDLHSMLIERRRVQDAVAHHRGSPVAIITAGPPGAGKSTALARDASISSYRSVDADDFKDALLRHELEAGTLDTHLTRLLGDRQPVHARSMEPCRARSTSASCSLNSICTATRGW
jgi:hypothetical protein